MHVEYTDSDSPTAERLLWELECERDILEPTELPDPFSSDAMPPADFDALLRAARWTALSPYGDPDHERGLGWQPVASPFFGGVQIEDYQLVPLLKALRMPRVNLLIADDVGLGKTVEAGLILTELMLRRRIRRVLVLAPASLRQQWVDELWNKFSLRFEVVGRRETERHRRRFGMDANPWRSFDRIVASYHYLRQSDVLEQFLSACHAPEGSPHLPWDLLIVDECHNLMPAPVGEDSQLCRSLKLIAPQFEHRLFLSATPHNGHTRSFTGLLEMLDPVRFSRMHEMTPAIRRRVADVVVRRLKRDINAGSNSPRFSTRNHPEALELDPEPRELALSAAFDALRGAIYGLVREGTRSRKRAGTFAVEILGKRLLSAPVVFAESWRRTKQGLGEAEAAREAEMATASQALRQDTKDDREFEQRQATAATVTGAWLKNFSDDVQDTVAQIESALRALGIDLDSGSPITEQTPVADTRFDSLIRLIDTNLRDAGKALSSTASDGFRNDERLIVFTEYKTTLDYVARRLREHYPSRRILTLFGGGGPEGMDEAAREVVKEAFNDPDSPVRVLVSTDAASEGLNLHHTARYLLHFDCPWNPSRLEQRNGRIDRYGQARSVTVYHFASKSDPDLRFIDHVIRKANEIREDLGRVNEIFDRAMYRRLVQGEDADTVQREMDQSIPVALQRAAVDRDLTVHTESSRETSLIERMAEEIDLDEYALGDTLEAAMAVSGGKPQLVTSGDSGCFRILNPNLSDWHDVIDTSVRLPDRGGAVGAVPQLAFGPAPFVQRHGPVEVFQPRRELLLIHLGHPMMQRALGVLARRRYPGPGQVSRWTVRRERVPAGADAVILLSIEEIAVNDLRETFHRWVRTVAFPVQRRALGARMPHQPARACRAGHDASDRAEEAAELLGDVSRSMREWLRAHAKELTADLAERLQEHGQEALEREEVRYRSRQAEVSALIEQTTIERLESEIAKLKQMADQGELFESGDSLAELERSVAEMQAEITRRRAHFEEMREQLRTERDRVLKVLLPKRFAMSGNAQVFPVAVEIRLAERRS